MRNISELFNFLNNMMSMTDIYQPAVILHLLERNGSSTKTELSRTLSGYDEAVQEYYEKILMRWPKITLTKQKYMLMTSETYKHSVTVVIGRSAIKTRLIFDSHVAS